MRKTITAVLLVAAVGACLAAFHWRDLQMDVLPLLDGRFGGYDASEVNDFLTKLPHEDKELYAWTALTLDIVFPIAYVALFVLVLKALFPKFDGVKLLPIAAGIADVGENIFIVWLLLGMSPPVSLAVSSIAAFFTMAKWLAVAATVAAVLWGVLSYLTTPRPVNDGALVRSMSEVLEWELRYLSRRRRHTSAASDDPRHTLIGLALSGGGIRSATTCFGMLQALSRQRILPLVDYVSTVSGGGYIGSCLSSLLTLRDENGAPIFTTKWDAFPFNPEYREGRAQVDHLRTHGSFLVARTGLLARESLRSIGQLVSGLIYHVGIALLALAIITFAYMAIVLVTARVQPGGPSQARGLHEILSERAPEPFIVSDPAYRRARPTPETPNVFREPTLSERIRHKYELLKDAGWNAANDEFGRRAVQGAAAYGAVLSVAVFAYLLMSYKRRSEPAAGESEYDARERALLRRVGFGGLGATVMLFAWAWRICPRPGGILWLFIPGVGLVSALVTSFLLHLLLPRLDMIDTWNRRMRSLWGAYQALVWYAAVTAWALALFPLAAYAVRDHESQVGLSSLVPLLFARIATARWQSGGGKWTLPEGLRRLLLGVAVVAGVLLALVAISASIIPEGTRPQDVQEAIARFTTAALLGTALFVVLGWIVDANRISPHFFYHDRLAETYLFTERRAPDDTLRTIRNSIRMRLKDLHGPETAPGDSTDAGTAPYHVVSAAINLAASRDLTRKDRKSGYFLFSKYFCGSLHTGYLRTTEYQGGHTELSRAMTISGAAASSGIGMGTFLAQAFATVLFNLRLGYWMPSPQSTISRKKGERWYFWPRWLCREMFMRTSERAVMVNLSDGGHTGDNVGVYPLLQRRCRVIIACDAERDGNIAFGSLTEALRHAYIDMGIDVDIDFSMVRKDPTTGMSRSHCAVGLIRYPPEARSGRQDELPPIGTDVPDETPSIGYLIYLKNSLTGDEPEPVLNYKSAHPAFPHESTADQFFDDAQFESYRALGAHIVEQSLGAWVNDPDFEQFRAKYWPFHNGA